MASQARMLSTFIFPRARLELIRALHYDCDGLPTVVSASDYAGQESIGRR